MAVRNSMQLLHMDVRKPGIFLPPMVYGDRKLGQNQVAKNKSVTPMWKAGILSTESVIYLMYSDG